MDRADRDRRASTPSIRAAAGSAPGGGSASIGWCSPSTRRRRSPAAAAEVLAEAWLAREPDEANAGWLRRVRFAGLERRSARARPAGGGAASRRWPRSISPRTRRTRWRASSIGSRRRTWTCRAGGGRALTYEADGTVTASAKLQELFGLAETPRVGPSGAPVVLSLLAPNGRPVQTTRDLRSFWDRTYPEVRRELRGRYPRHPWPEDPWTATPTARAKPRPRS